MRQIAIGLIAMLPFAAHGEYRSVSWFASHDLERHAQLRWCRDNAGLAPHNPNCINAEEAGTDSLLRRLNAHIAAGMAAERARGARW